jgi:ATP-dependent 26S proteasome regulatory subunit
LIGKASKLDVKTVNREAGLMAARKEKMAINYVDFEGFKTALVRLTILSSDILGGQEDSNLKRK